MSKYEIDLFLRGLKNKIHSYYFNYWLSEINDRDKNPILRTYCSFKSHLKAEQYISCKIPTKYKRLIAQLRVSSHHLGIETGRHQKPVIPSNRRYCKFCPDQDAIDDEKHFILDCKFHIAERESLLLVIRTTDKFLSTDVNNKDMLFRYIMSNENPIIIEALGKYIEQGFKRRKITDVN